MISSLSFYFFLVRVCHADVFSFIEIKSRRRKRDDQIIRRAYNNNRFSPCWFFYFFSSASSCFLLSNPFPPLAQSFLPSYRSAQLLILTSGRERLSWEPPQELKRQMKEIPFFLSPSCFDYYYDDTSTTTTNNNYYYHRGQTSFSFVPCI